MRIIILTIYLLACCAIARAATVVDYDFNNQSWGVMSDHGSAWTMMSSGGVDNSPAIRLTYDQATTDRWWAVIPLSTLETNTVWIEFDTKIDGTPSGGSKFVKFFGSTQSTKNNMTFALDYVAGNVQGQVGYNGDVTCAARYFAGDKADTCGATVVFPGNPVTITNTWGHYKIYVKRADPDVHNGEVRVWFNGTEMAHFTGMDSNPAAFVDPEPGFDSVQLGGYIHAPNFTGGTWYLWYDNLYVGTTEKDSTPTCSDGIQNGDETGVDCGGSCSACSTVSIPIGVGTMPIGPGSMPISVQ